MPRYEPLETGFRLEASASDLIAFHWQTDGIAADFLLPEDDARLLRVSFDRSCIVRLLDEMALSTEEDETANEGRVPEHFAYRVVGASFARVQSEAWKAASGPTVHYQFVTGWGCMDVLSAGTPSFSVVTRQVD